MTETTEDLLRRARDHDPMTEPYSTRPIMNAMADRIEELEAKLAAAQDQLRKLGETI